MNKPAKSARLSTADRVLGLGLCFLIPLGLVLTSTVRSRMLTESRTPREALELFIDTQETLKPRKEPLMAAAENLFRELRDEAL